MSAKITATRQAAFLKALNATGNQTIAAERAKVSRSWVRLHRGRDPEFDAAVREACLGFARQERAGVRPPSGWGFLDGEELVVRGTGGSGQAKGRRVQIARARLHQWDARVEDRFVAVLAATCNVKAACSEVGMSATSAYNHRSRWPAFARRWDEAVAIGTERIEGALLQSGLNLFATPDEVSCEAPIPPMTVAQAIHFLAMHQRKTRGIGRRPGLPPREPTLAEVRADMMQRLGAMERMRTVSEADKARDREAWARRRRACGRG